MIAEDLDRALPGPALVFGSPPATGGGPGGRDLDLLVRPAEHAAATEVLAAAGFVRDGDDWVRFAARTAEHVELVPAARWALPDAELAALFDEARPLAGWSQLVAPAPHHALLILARRISSGARNLDERRLARIRDAVAADAAAWDEAARRAPAWGMVLALTAMRRLADGEQLSAGDVAAAAQERLRHRGTALAPARAWRTALRPPTRGRVVALSGLDGAGKSSQAAALVSALEALGYPATSTWTRLSHNPELERLAQPAVRLLRRVRRRPPPPEAIVASADVDPSRLRSDSQRLRQSSPLLTAAWAAVVAVLNGRSQRQATAPHLRAGRMVVCDRWTLDSAVHLRYRYGERRRFRLQAALVRVLSPRPVRTFFIDIPPEVAYARKDDHYDVDQLRRHAALYAQEWQAHGARRIDGQLPPDVIAATIAEEVWRALRAAR